MLLPDRHVIAEPCMTEGFLQFGGVFHHPLPFREQVPSEAGADHALHQGIGHYACLLWIVGEIVQVKIVFQGECGPKAVHHPGEGQFKNEGGHGTNQGGDDGSCQIGFSFQ